MQHWAEFGLSRFPSMSARRPIDLPPPMQALLDERVASLEEPLTGLTVDGAVQRGLFNLQASSGVATAELTEVRV